MLVKEGNRICLDACAAPEPADDLLFHDYYSRTPQICLTGRPLQAEPAAEVLLDGNDVARLVACAVRHPSLNMRHAVLTAIWNHPDSLREIFRFGLQAPPEFAEIRQVVAEELAKNSAAALAVANPDKPAGGTLLPHLPLPAHLRRGDR